jgi:hypothetical protein
MTSLASLPAPFGVSPVMGGTLPEHSNDGYVAAAYIVFFVLVLVYVAIMAIRLGRVERKVEALRSDANHGPPTRARGAASDEDPTRPDEDLARPDEDPARPSLGRPRERTLTGTGETV